jgi:hypothetical protein
VVRSLDALTTLVIKMVCVKPETIVRSSQILTRVMKMEMALVTPLITVFRSLIQISETAIMTDWVMYVISRAVSQSMRSSVMGVIMTVMVRSMRRRT